MGLFVSLFKQQDQDQNFSPAGNLLDHIWCLVPFMAFALGATGCDCYIGAVLTRIHMAPTWAPWDYFNCAQCLPIFWVLTQICGMERVNIPTGKKRESKPTRLKQSLESLKFLGR